jgi:hypothetical protein
MSLAIVGLDGNPWTQRDLDGSGSNIIVSKHKLTFTSNYVTGGDTLDLSAIASLIPSGALPLTVVITEQGTAAVPSLSAAGGFYELIQAAVPALNNYKIKVFKNTAGSVAEYSAGAYGTDVTTDNVFLEISWRKMLSS